MGGTSRDLLNRLKRLWGRTAKAVGEHQLVEWVGAAVLVTWTWMKANPTLAIVLTIAVVAGLAVIRVKRRSLASRNAQDEVRPAGKATDLEVDFESRTSSLPSEREALGQLTVLSRESLTRSLDLIQGRRFLTPQIEQEFSFRLTNEIQRNHPSTTVRVEFAEFDKTHRALRVTAFTNLPPSVADRQYAIKGITPNGKSSVAGSAFCVSGVVHEANARASDVAQHFDDEADRQGGPACDIASVCVRRGTTMQPVRVLSLSVSEPNVLTTRDLNILIAYADLLGRLRPPRKARSRRNRGAGSSGSHWRQ